MKNEAGREQDRQTKRVFVRSSYSVVYYYTNHAEKKTDTILYCVDVLGVFTPSTSNVLLHLAFIKCKKERIVEIWMDILDEGPAPVRPSLLYTAVPSIVCANARRMEGALCPENGNVQVRQGY